MMVNLLNNNAMRKYFLPIISFVSLFLFYGCTKEINPYETPKTGIPFEITASTPESKTINENLNTKWAANDCIILFHSVAGLNTYESDGKFTIPVSLLGSNRFTGSLHSALNQSQSYDWCMYYPYKNSLTSPENNKQAVFTIGSEMSKKQSQTGNDSMSHLAGENFPMYGCVSNILGSNMPNITMNHLSSIVEVEVVNELDEDISVTGVDFIANENIVGNYYIDATSNPVTYTDASEDAASKVASLSVTGADALKKTESAKFYLGIRPFVAKSGNKLTVKVGTSSAKGPGIHIKEYDLSKDFTFSAGKIKTLKVKYNTPLEKEELLWSETWDNGKSGSKPSVYDKSSTTVYGGGAVIYSQTGDTKLYSTVFPTINLMIKANESFTVSDIPTAGARSAVLTFVSNHNKPKEYNLTSTSGVQIAEPIIKGKGSQHTVKGKGSQYNVIYNIAINQGVEKLDLTFKNNGKNNVRIDDIKLVGTVSGGGGQIGEGEVPSALVTTEAISNIGASYATLKGSFSNATSIPVKAGFKYGISSDNLDKETLVDGSLTYSSGHFSKYLSGLNKETKYYYKAFVEVKGTGKHSSDKSVFYGDVQSFTTPATGSGGGSEKAALPYSWLELPAASPTMTGENFYYKTNRVNFKGVDQRNYSYLYDASMYTSYWVAYPLCKTNTIGKRNDNWGPKDSNVPEKYQILLKKSYGPQADGLSYDRGHQVPSGDRRNSLDMQHQCNYPTNMTPQLSKLNQQGWERLETNVRSFIPSDDTLYVVTGASFNKIGENKTIKKVVNQNDDIEVPVPNYYWKVLLKVHRDGGGNIIAASTIGFWVEHKPIAKEDVMQYSCSVNQIEKDTGFNFFVNLPESIEEGAESNSDLNAFKSF